jgi:EpsI family protein
MKKKLLVSILILIIGGFLGNILRYSEKAPDRVADFSGIPLQYGEYTGVEQPMADFAYDILQADVSTLRDYITIAGRRTQLFVAYFKSQKYGSQIHSPKHCLPGGGWRIDRIIPRQIELDEGIYKDINQLLISVTNYKAVMFYWFETRSGSIRNEYGLKLDLLKNALFFQPTDAAIIRVTVDATDGDYEKAVQFGLQFLSDFYPSVKSSLPF